MNHKITRKRDIFITFPYSSNARKALKITRNIYTKLQAMYPNLFEGQIMRSYKRIKNLADYLVSANHGRPVTPHALGQRSPKSAKNGVLQQRSPVQ